LLTTLLNFSVKKLDSASKLSLLYPSKVFVIISEQLFRGKGGGGGSGSGSYPVLQK